MALKLLHLSDIHFKHFDGKDYLDQDVEIRNELEIDLENLTSRIGNIDAILVGGDIAFSGNDEEYEIADAWLKKVCKIVGCSEENILTVPGNHDVNRSEICVVVETLQRRFKEMKKRTDIDSGLSEFLKSEASYAILSKPLNNYLNFAQKFGTVPTTGNPLYWEKDFAFDGATLRIRGINSAIVSNEKDEKNLSKLILGSLQTQLLRKQDVIYLVLCHHPPDWLIDGDEVDTDLVAKAKVHLFGHKHSIKVTQIDQSLRLAAGAMQPSRKETDWDPRYNIIQIGIHEKDNSSEVKVEIWKRTWNKQSGKFKADITDDNKEVHTYHLRHDEIVPGKGKNKTVHEPVPTAPNKMDEKIEVIDTNNPDPIRKLTYMFLSLQYHKKIEIASSLKLIEDSDRELLELQKSQAYLTRAKERQCLAELWDKTIEMLPEKPQMQNPFK